MLDRLITHPAAPWVSLAFAAASLAAFVFLSLWSPMP